jgi:propionyl-CoA synthetase
LCRGQILCSHPDIAEAVVVGMRDDFKGQIPIGLAILNSNCKKTPSEIEKEVVQMVRSRIGAVAVFKRLVVVDRLPKTRSGKVTRNIIRKIADGLEFSIPATVEDPAVFGEIKAVIDREHAAANQNKVM